MNMFAECKAILCEKDMSISQSINGFPMTGANSKAKIEY